LKKDFSLPVVWFPVSSSLAIMKIIKRGKTEENSLIKNNQQPSKSYPMNLVKE
jgi:hypothetical protein